MTHEESKTAQRFLNELCEYLLAQGFEARFDDEFENFYVSPINGKNVKIQKITINIEIDGSSVLARFKWSHSWNPSDGIFEDCFVNRDTDDCRTSHDITVEGSVNDYVELKIVREPIKKFVLDTTEDVKMVGNLHKLVRHLNNTFN